MNKCTRIEPLLYLYREGELSSEEKADVDEHLASCRRCQAIRDQLGSMEDSLRPVRQVAPELSSEPQDIADMINRILRTTRRSSPRGDDLSYVEILVRWLRPAVRLALIAAAVLFLFQEARDSSLMAGLENRLRLRGNAVAAEALRRNNLSLFQRQASTLITRQTSAAALGDPASALFGYGWAAWSRQNQDLFESFAQKYPQLSGISLDDGLDARERLILATEGKSFLKEFEQLTAQGEQ